MAIQQHPAVFQAIKFESRFNGQPCLALFQRDFIEKQPESLHPVTRAIIDGATRFVAADAFSAIHNLKELQRKTAPVWDLVDILVTPTAGSVYKIAEVEADPIRTNSNLGYYTNFVNQLDLCALSVPNAFQPNRLPAGITLIAPAFHDARLAAIGQAFHRATGLPLGTVKTHASRGREKLKQLLSEWQTA